LFYFYTKIDVIGHQLLELFWKFWMQSLKNNKLLLNKLIINIQLLERTNNIIDREEFLFDRQYHGFYRKAAPLELCYLLF